MMRDNNYLVACVRTFGVLPLYNNNSDIECGTFDSLISNKRVDQSMILNGVFIPKFEQTYDVRNVLPDIYRYCSITGGRQSIENLFKTTFFKSFEEVADMDPKEIVIKQFVHYLTVCCKDISDVDVVYVPNEFIKDENCKIEYDASNININDYVKLKLIRVVSEDELNKMCAKMLTSGVALQHQTIKDIFRIMQTLDTFDSYVHEHIDEIKNKEARSIIYVSTDLVPKNAEEFLRYLLAKYINYPLKIKNRRTFKSLTHLSENLQQGVHDDFVAYIDRYGYEPLASIFYRNKMLFLALKKSNNMSYIINRIRRLAPKYHKPMQKKILDQLTDTQLWAKVGWMNINDNEDYIRFENNMLHELNKVTIFKKITLLNALRNYKNKPENMLYHIRNGSSFVKIKEKENDINE